MQDDEVKALAKKLGKVPITHFYFSQRYPGERFGNHIRLSPKGAEAMARVALEFCERRQAVKKENERREKSWRK